jgi:PAS domain S-box-containing protein
MKDEGKTKEQLLSELEEARFRLKKLESALRHPRPMEPESKPTGTFASGEHLSRILDAIGDPVFVKDREHKFAFVNDAFCALVGKKREEFPGKTDYDFFPREQVDVFLEKDEEVFRTGRVNVNEESITDAGGEVRTIVTKKTLYTDDAGSPFIVGVIRDITERRKAEEERLKLSTIVENSQAFVGLADFEGNVSYINPAGRRMMGIPDDRVEGLRIVDFVPESQRDFFQSRIQPELMEKGIWKGELQIKSPLSGEIMDIDNTASLIRDPVDQRPLYIATTMQDISLRKKAENELRESEAKFRSIFENIQDVYYEVTVDGTILEVSPSVLMVSDYSREEVIGKNLFDFYADPEARRMFVEQIRKKGWMVDVEVMLKNRDGSLVPCSVTARFIKDEEHPDGKIVGVMREIGRRKTLEKALAWEAHVRRLLTELSSRLISTHPLEEISEFVLDAAKGLTDSLYGFVGYIDSSTGNLVNSTMTRDIWEICNVEQKSFVFHEFKGLWGWVLNQRQSMLSNDPAGDPRSGGVPAGHVAIERFASVPVMDGDRLMGQIALANSSRPYTEEDISLLKRLGTIFMLALQRKWGDLDREKLIGELRKALDDVKKLSGLLPICSNCKKVRNDQGYWEQIEVYIRDHSGADFSHGICPECAKKLYPDIDLVGKE